MTTRPSITGIRQAGLYAPDPAALAKFYRETLGLQIVGMSRLNPAGVCHTVALSSRPEVEAEQLLIDANPENGYTAFAVASLADLRVFHQVIIECGLPIRWALNHGVSLAFYFTDPAGNLIKLFWPTGIDYPQPHGHPIDLTQSEAALRQDVADLVAQRKGAKGGKI